MKKTLLLAILGASTLTLASGSVKLTNTLNKEPLTKEGFKTEHTLDAKLSENDITAETQLKTKGEHTGTEYKFGESVTGHVKLGYDNKTVAVSGKFEFDNKITLDGSYTYKKDPLTVKPAFELKSTVFKANSLKLSNHIGYVVDEKLTLKNNVVLNTAFVDEKYPSLLTVDGIVEYKATDDLKLTNKLTVEKSLNGTKGSFSLPTKVLLGDDVKFESNELGKLAVNNKTTANLKYNSELELNGNVVLGHSRYSLEKASTVSYDASVSGKVSYKSEEIKGLEASSNLEYKFNLSSLKEEAFELKLKDHNVTLGGTVSYVATLSDGLTLTPKLELKHILDVNSSTVVLGGEKTLKTISNNLTLTPSLSLNYKVNKINATLSAETPVSFSGKKFNDVKEKKEVKEEFGYKKTNLKSTLSLGYSW